MECQDQMFLRNSESKNSTTFDLWLFVSSSVVVAGILNYGFMLLASRNLAVEQFNDLIFLFSISTALTMIVSPIASTLLGSKTAQHQEKDGTPVWQFLRFSFWIILVPITVLLCSFYFVGGVDLPAIIVSILWLPVLLLMSIGTVLLQMQKRYIFFGLFPLFAAISKLIVLGTSFSFNMNAVKIVLCLQISLAILASIQFKISGGLRSRYLKLSRYYFVSTIVFFLLVSLLLSGEVFLSRMTLAKEDVYIVTLGMVIGKLTYLFSVPLVDLVLADLYREVDLSAKRKIVAMTVKRILLVSLISSAVAIFIREPFFQFIKGDREFVSVTVLILLLLNGFLAAVLQLLVHFSVSMKAINLIPKCFFVILTVIIGSTFFESSVKSVLCTVTFVLTGSIAVLTYPNLFRTWLVLDRKWVV
jgi:hypothetical protein